MRGQWPSGSESGERTDTGGCRRLVAAAYLHDIGYAPELAITGFHPLDGARHLRVTRARAARRIGGSPHPSASRGQAPRSGGGSLLSSTTRTASCRLHWRIAI